MLVKAITENLHNHIVECVGEIFCTLVYFIFRICVPLTIVVVEAIGSDSHTGFCVPSNFIEWCVCLAIFLIMAWSLLLHLYEIGCELILPVLDQNSADKLTEQYLLCLPSTSPQTQLVDLYMSLVFRYKLEYDRWISRQKFFSNYSENKKNYLIIKEFCFDLLKIILILKLQGGLKYQYELVDDKELRLEPDCTGF